MIRYGLSFTILLAGFSAQSAQAGEPAVPPPYEGVYQPHGVDEIGLWREDDESEKALAASAVVIRDEQLTSYVRGVLCSTVGPDRCSSTRVYVIREPTFNATMSVNGTMRIHSGLLLRIRSEAELGAVLGHEFGHFEKRHGLARFKANRQGSDILAWAQVLSSMAATYSAQTNYQNLELSVYGTLFRYRRDNEREADRLGIAYLNSSQFRPQAAAAVWRNLMAEAEASARLRGLKKPNFNAIAFTASHPPDAERAGYLSALALPDAATRDDGGERYRAKMARWLPIFMGDQIKLNDFGGSEYIIGSLAQNGWTAELWFARGELYRTRGNPRDLVNAVDFYGRAIAMDDAMAVAYRGFGLSLIKTGQRADGQAALRKYLELSPEAPDASMIRIMLPKEEIQK